jgi:Domain of unknown function (DUF4760)
MTLRVPVKWIIVGLFLLLEGILVVIYGYHDDHDRATIAFTATVLGGAFALYTYLQGIDERRTQNAHHLIERWNNADMMSIRLVLLDVMENRLDPKNVTRNDPAILERRSHIVTVLNFFEELSIAVIKKTANEDRLKDFFSSIVQQAFAKLEDWIRAERKTDNEPAYYCHFEVLAERWKG